MKDDLLGAVSFLTILGGGRPPKESSKYWFSLAGVLVAAVSGLLWQIMGSSFARLLAAFLVVLVILLLTGAIHIDGLADAADRPVLPSANLLRGASGGWRSCQQSQDLPGPMPSET